MQVLSTHPITVFVKHFFCLFVIYFEYLFLPPKLSIKMQMTLCHHIHHSMAELNWKAASSAAPSTASQKITWSISHQFVHPSMHQFVIQSLYDCIDTKLPNAKILKANKQKKKQIKFKFLLHYTNRMEKFTFFGYSFFLLWIWQWKFFAIRMNVLSWRFEFLISWSDVSFVVAWIFSSFASRIWTLI